MYFDGVSGIPQLSLKTRACLVALQRVFDLAVIVVMIVSTNLKLFHTIVFNINTIIINHIKIIGIV